MHPDDNDRDIQTAIGFLRTDNPVPVDLIARLLEAGVDYSALEEKYAI